ncbi:MAG TPA: hypothetical protein PK683_09350, partial [Leptospiraceae bacterium]|nr:hypothetical protein [Leptospiraceae bacterium]
MEFSAWGSEFRENGKQRLVEHYLPLLAVHYPLFFRLFPELQAPNPELYFIHTDSFKQKGENYEKNSD